jgi:hypothetical protein
MDGLVGYGSDSSSSSSSIGSMPKTDGDARTGSQANQSLPPPKRQRRWDNGSTNTNNTSNKPLSPRLSSVTQASMVLCDANYLARRPFQDASVSMDESSHTFLQERLASFSDRKDGSGHGGYATKLKQSHDFHNPRFMENAASQIGITDTNQLGSNFPHQESFEDYEYNLVLLEEQARSKVYERIQEEHTHAQTETRDSAELFVQSKMEQALQAHCQR